MLGRLARTMLAERAALPRFLDPTLFADPALDILLFLFVEGQAGGDVSTMACCNAARVPRTTALRWLKLLAGHGMVIASDDADDRRMTLLRLSPAARRDMAGWLAHVAATREFDREQVSG